MGFYCTNKLDQAIRWANRSDGTPIINSYDYEPDNSLNILRFDQLTDEWLDFVAHCRSRETHRHDIVEGPMANDTIWNYVNDFISGKIKKNNFEHLQNFDILPIKSASTR